MTDNRRTPDRASKSPSAKGPFGWQWFGQARPPFAETPGPEQESVWDYPRPPRIERDTREVIVRIEAIEVARSRRCWRMLETASPPTFYLPPQDVRSDLLAPCPGLSHCEWKGEARYWSVVAPESQLEGVAWSYPNPLPAFAAIRNHVSFYPGRIECSVGGVRVLPQPGRFYGGWITPEIAGPFKGEPGSEAW